MRIRRKTDISTFWSFDEEDDRTMLLMSRKIVVKQMRHTSIAFPFEGKVVPKGSDEVDTQKA